MTNRDEMNRVQILLAELFQKKTNKSIAERRVDQMVKFFNSDAPDEWYAYDVPQLTFPTKEDAIQAEIKWLESEKSE